MWDAKGRPYVEIYSGTLQAIYTKYISYLNANGVKYFMSTSLDFRISKGIEQLLATLSSKVQCCPESMAFA